MAPVLISNRTVPALSVMPSLLATTSAAFSAVVSADVESDAACVAVVLAVLAVAFCEYPVAFAAANVA